MHWSWFIVAVYQIQDRSGRYSSVVWTALEYVGLFLIVLLHEFGHALACRQVGGQADQIVLWPLGGVAYVSPPSRPGATLWSIAAGPLVNVALVPILLGLVFGLQALGWDEGSNSYQLAWSVCKMNFVILAFNLLPIYPLDGGQILRALLWFVLGRARSLMVAAMIGFAGFAIFAVIAMWLHSGWMLILAVFVLLLCGRGLLQARLLAKAERLPRRDGFACPSCKQAPVTGLFWMCHKCRAKFDTFETRATCPGCGEQFPVTRCPDCGASSPFNEWIVPGGIPPLITR